MAEAYKEFQETSGRYIDALRETNAAARRVAPRPTPRARGPLQVSFEKETGAADRRLDDLEKLHQAVADHNL